MPLQDREGLFVELKHPSSNAIDNVKCNPLLFDATDVHVTVDGVVITDLLFTHLFTSYYKMKL